MITITTIKDIKDFYALDVTEGRKRGWISLDSAQEIEREFHRIVEWDREAFWDELSLELMKEIDNAVREESYGVETPIGKSCITCLSTGCKLGLILLHYKDRDLRILTSFSRAGENVWKFIAKHFDISLVMLGEKLESLLSNDLDCDVWIDGKLYTKENMRELWDMVLGKEDMIYELTPETEQESYEWWLKKNEGDFFWPLQDKCSFGSMLSMVPDWGNVCKEDLPKRYQVVNTCTYITNETIFRRLPLWIIGRNGENYEFSTRCSIKYPKFMELLVYDILNGEYRLDDYGNGQSYMERYEEYFVLVLSDEERCPVKEYPESTLYGVLCNPGRKEITILEPRQAVVWFHDWYRKLK